MLANSEVEAFRTHSNWIRAFATLAGSGATMTSQARARTRLAEGAALIPVPGGTLGQPADVFPCLHRAWGTELLLNLATRVATEEELLRLANSWGAVQAYYAAYGATQALIVAEGRRRPISHPATQREFVELWVRRAVNLPPWSLAVGAPENPTADADGVLNGPGRKVDVGIHPWSGCSPESCWDIAANALRSTREDAAGEQLRKERDKKLRDRKKDWHTQEDARVSGGGKPRHEPVWPTRTTLTSVESAAVRTRVRPYTVLDYLYRLRIKANYEDARMFTDGPQDQDDSARVARDLVALTAGTMLVHEVRVAKLIGPSVLVAECEEWVARNNPPGLRTGLASRVEALRQIL